MHALVHEFWHGFTHTDKGVIRLWLDLLLRPRKTYQDYFNGHRKSYFSPVVFFLVSFGIYIYLDLKVFEYQDYTSFLRQHQAVNNEFGRYVQEHAKTIALLLLPVKALLSWAFFFRRRNLAECFVFWLFCTGFINTILVLLTPLRLALIAKKDTLDNWLDILVILIMLVHAFAVFGNSWINYIKTVLLIFFLAILSRYTIDYALYRHLATDPQTIAIMTETKKHLSPPTLWDAVGEVIYTSDGYDPFDF
jgi:hypothetical protein